MPSKVSASGFAIVPYALMDSVQDAAIWAVYATVHRHGFGSGEGCWTSLETIRRETGVSRKLVQRSLRWLKDSGWLMAESRPGYTTVYRVLTEDPGGTDLGRKRPRSKTTRVKNDLGGRSETTWGGRSKTTYEQEPHNKNPLTRTPIKGASSETTPEKKDPLRLKRLPEGAVPQELVDCRDLLIEFWAAKKGTRSSRVFTRVCNKLRSWTSEQRTDALERSIANGWGDVFEPRRQASASSATRQWTDEQWKALDTASLF
jgi:hypothetical protein